jgi:G protein-coupled receptor GPR1
MEAKRQTMLLQMRMNFVYPVVYTALWIVPIALNCMQFLNKYAENSPPALEAISTLSVASMGFADAVYFLVHEQPWKPARPAF